MAKAMKNMSNPRMKPEFTCKHFFRDQGVGDAEFSVIGFGCNVNEAPFFLDRHPYENDWLFIHFKDPVDVSIDGALRHLDEPFLLFWRPGVARSYGNRETSWRHSWIHATGARVAEVIGRCDLRSGAPYTVPDGPFNALFFSALRDETIEELHPDPRILGNLFEIWLRRMRRAIGEPRRNPPDRMDLIRRKIEDGTADWLPVEQLAALARMSAPHFSSEFRRYFGQSPGRYQMETRIARAQDLLKRGQHSIGEVAEQLGYADLFSFSRSFKRIVGLSPRIWLTTPFGVPGEARFRPGEM
jgi:AraC-like DNA-binding protein